MCVLDRVLVCHFLAIIYFDDRSMTGESDSERVQIMSSRTSKADGGYVSVQVKNIEIWSQNDLNYKLGPALLQFPPNQPGLAIIRREVVEGSRKVTMQTRKFNEKDAQPTEPEVGSSTACEMKRDISLACES